MQCSTSSTSSGRRAARLPPLSTGGRTDQQDRAWGLGKYGGRLERVGHADRFHRREKKDLPRGKEPEHVSAPPFAPFRTARHGRGHPDPAEITPRSRDGHSPARPWSRTSLIEKLSVSSMHSLSIPMPQPAVGGSPYSSACHVEAPVLLLLL